MKLLDFIQANLTRVSVYHHDLDGLCSESDPHGDYVRYDDLIELIERFKKEGKAMKHFYYSVQCAQDRQAAGWKPTMKAEINGKVVEFTHFQTTKTEGVVYATDERYLGVGRKTK